MLEIVFFNFAKKQTAASTQCFGRVGKSMFQPPGVRVTPSNIGWGSAICKNCNPINDQSLRVKNRVSSWNFVTPQKSD